MARDIMFTFTFISVYFHLTTPAYKILTPDIQSTNKHVYIHVCISYLLNECLKYNKFSKCLLYFSLMHQPGGELLLTRKSIPDLGRHIDKMQVNVFVYQISCHSSCQQLVRLRTITATQSENSTRNYLDTQILQETRRTRLKRVRLIRDASFRCKTH